MKITLIPILSDNYAYLLEGENGEIGLVDPGEAAPVISVLEQKSLSLNTIFCTHHHGDHIGGVEALKSKYGCKVVGPEDERGRIPSIDTGVREGDVFDFGGEGVQVFETPGHTKHHICFYAPQSRALFSGDTLFAMGCGRLFEGTPEQMFQSLQKLFALPDDTKIYCGHEYTLSNATFCLSVDKDNIALKMRYGNVQELREQGVPTIPFTLRDEKATNAFLRAGSAEEFASVRALKDRF